MVSAPVEVPLYVTVLAAAAIALAYYVVRLRDLVYASIALAVLGSMTAGIIALEGFPLVAAYLVLVYVGAAVMFIIITISMLGPSGREEVDTFKGLVTGAAIGAMAILALIAMGLYNIVYVTPSPVGTAEAAQEALRRYLPVLALIFVGQAATIVEAIAISRRGEGQ